MAQQAAASTSTDERRGGRGTVETRTTGRYFGWGTHGRKTMIDRLTEGLTPVSAFY